ncbi:uncharacterized protein LOC129778684 [Toxorhynchites rutilus septentrionalis]|uniref:uncharacterized protein LOC129778684 n=1 Tax=Toxorhynchites rutilus septentrionalis TaxID=329112 RepID=UPI002478AA87|nr:uncharacterized protein LOC129778684 [Toxorhynchites rutilus septentrionalis]
MGLKLISFAASKNMAICSTFFQHKLLYKYTWRSPNQTETQIDHVFIDCRHFSDIIEVRSYRSANVDSDHYLVMLKMRPKLAVVNNIRYRRPPRLNLARLKQLDVAGNYVHSLEAALPEEDELNETPLEDCWNTIKQPSTAYQRTYSEEDELNETPLEDILGHVERIQRNV